MNRWRFALTRRWLGYLAMAIVFAIACVLLSRWQVGRNNDTVAESKLVTTNYAASPVPIGELLPRLAAFSPKDTWRSVRLEGRYEASHQLLVRNRSLGGNPGFEVLIPLRLDDGSVFMVDRGWLPVGSRQDAPDHVPAAPGGRVTVIARLQASEPVLPGRTAPSGQLPEINVPMAAAATGDRASAYTGGYGLMASESPAPPSRPIAAPKPVIDPGPYLSYAFQWILFALFGFFGLWWALRQEYRLRNASDPEERERALARDAKARKRAPTDAEIEDAIVEGRIQELSPG